MSGKTSKSIEIGITGHRDIPLADIPKLKLSLTEIFTAKKNLHPNNAIRIHTGLAEGADFLAAEVALTLGIDTVAVLPMPIDIYLDDFPDLESKEKLVHLLDQSSEIYQCEESTLLDNRSDYYVSLANYLVEKCDIIIALWDGKSQHSQAGGTADVIKRRLVRAKSNSQPNITVYESAQIIQIKTRRIKNLLSATEEISVHEIGMISEIDDFWTQLLD